MAGDKLKQISGNYERKGAESAYFEINEIRHGIFQIKGFAHWGAGKKGGPNVGTLDFISSIENNSAFFKDEIDGNKIFINLQFKNDELTVKEHYYPTRFGYFGVNVSFEGKYLKIIKSH